MQTKLGWMHRGPLPQKEIVKIATERLVAPEVDTLVEPLKTWWRLESYVSKCSVSGRCKEEKKAFQILKATTKFDGER